MAVISTVSTMFQNLGENTPPSYPDLFNEAEITFKREYQEKFTELPNRMRGSGRDMAARKLAPEETAEFKVRTGQSVLLDGLRLEALTALQRIIDVYKKTIEQCAPPSLDKSTMLCLLRMNIGVKAIETQYTHLFQTSLSSLRDSLSSIETLKAEIEKEWNHFDIAFAEANAAMNHQGGFWNLFGSTKPFPEAARAEFRAQVNKQTSDVSAEPVPAT